MLIDEQNEHRHLVRRAGVTLRRDRALADDQGIWNSAILNAMNAARTTKNALRIAAAAASARGKSPSADGGDQPLPEQPLIPVERGAAHKVWLPGHRLELHTRVDDHRFNARFSNINIETTTCSFLFILTNADFDSGAQDLIRRSRG